MFSSSDQTICDATLTNPEQADNLGGYAKRLVAVLPKGLDIFGVLRWEQDAFGKGRTAVVGVPACFVDAAKMKALPVGFERTTSCSLSGCSAN